MSHVDSDYYYAFHECFYHKPTDTVPHSCTENPVNVSAETMEGLKWVLERMTAALAKPVLEFDGNKIVEVHD